MNVDIGIGSCIHRLLDVSGLAGARTRLQRRLLLVFRHLKLGSQAFMLL